MKKQPWSCPAIAAAAVLAVGTASYATSAEWPSPTAAPRPSLNPPAVLIDKVETDGKIPPLENEVQCQGGMVGSASPTYGVEQTPDGPRLMGGGAASSEDALSRFLRHSYPGAEHDQADLIEYTAESNVWAFTNSRVYGTKLIIHVIRIGDGWTIGGWEGCNSYLMEIGR